MYHDDDEETTHTAPLGGGPIGPIVPYENPNAD